MITIKLFKMVISISSTREERLKEINYKENSRWIAKVTKTVEKMRDEDTHEFISGLHAASNFDLMNSASMLTLLDEDVLAKKDWYVIDTKKLKLIDVIKTKISFSFL